MSKQWLPGFGSFNVRTDVDACNCTWGLYGHRKRVCTGRLLWEKNHLLHRVRTCMIIAPGFLVRHSTNWAIFFEVIANGLSCVCMCFSGAEQSIWWHRSPADQACEKGQRWGEEDQEQVKGYKVSWSQSPISEQEWVPVLDLTVRLRVCTSLRFESKSAWPVSDLIAGVCTQSLIL